MLNFADFNEVYASKPPTFEETHANPQPVLLVPMPQWLRRVKRVPL